MPYINIRVAGSLSRNQKEDICQGITTLMQDIAGKPPEATYIVIDEVKRENWAKAGKLIG